MIGLGRAIACTRLERGWKRKDLVVRAGISYPFLADVENGRKDPSLSMLRGIAAALGTTASALLERGETLERGEV